MPIHIPGGEQYPSLVHATGLVSAEGRPAAPVAYFSITGSTNDIVSSIRRNLPPAAAFFQAKGAFRLVSSCNNSDANRKCSNDCICLKIHDCTPCVHPASHKKAARMEGAKRGPPSMPGPLVVTMLCLFALMCADRCVYNHKSAPGPRLSFSSPFLSCVGVLDILLGCRLVCFKHGQGGCL